MLDIKLIRKDREAIEKKIKTKEPAISLDLVCTYDNQIRELKTKVEHLKSIRNEASKKIGELKQKGENATEIIEEVARYADEIHSIDHQLAELESKLIFELGKIPNIPDEKVKISQDPKDNEILKEFGKKREFDFSPKNHVELNEQLHLFDFKRGAKISGAGWPIYRGLGARLEWALINYMIATHLKNGFEQWIPPLLVKPETMFGAGQIPKFESQLFKIRDEDYHLYLIPTSEMALNGLHADEIIPEDQLPLKYMAYTPCFRREAGAAGSQERGLIRVHQFNKVEMFCFTRPEESVEVFQKMMDSAEEILQGLGMHYRNALLVTGDMSFTSAYTVDIEVWLPGQNRYYEVSSVSNCTKYQSLRSNIRMRRSDDKRVEHVHTLNGSGLATSRLMVALLENNQNADGSINIPKVLQSLLGGIEKLSPSTCL